MTLAALLAAAAAATPIPQGPNAGSLPTFGGHVVRPQPIAAPAVPRHPHMAPNGRSNIHDDAYQSDTYVGLGPLGTGGIDTLSSFKGSECASITTRARRAVRRDRARPFTTVVRRARRVGAHARLRDGRVLRVAHRGCL